MVTRHTLVINGGGFTPGVELGHTNRHRPPHATWAAEVIGWAGVIDATVLGRCNHALKLAQRFGDVEVCAT